MADHSSAKKAIRQTIRKTAINKSRMSMIRTYVKKVDQAIASGSKADAGIALKMAQSNLMRGVKKRIIKLRTASRRISKLAKKVKNMS